MQLSTSHIDSVSITYTAGETIDELLANIRAVYENHIKSLQRNSPSELKIHDIEIAAEEYYSSPRAILNISYTRKETESERISRVLQEKLRDEALRKQYEELKKKFGDK